MRYTITVFIILAAALVAAPSFAQDTETATVSKPGDGISFPKPDGWVAKDGGKGVVVRLQAAGESGSYIDFRMAPDVDEKKATTFFTSFHASLQSAGLKKVRDTAATTYGEHAGSETEYETKGKSGAYRLVIWQIHIGKRAWMVAGFFDAKERDTLYRDYATIITSVVFSQE